MGAAPGPMCHPAWMATLPDRIAAERIELRRWDPAFAEALCDAVSTSLAELRPWMPWAQEAPTVDGLWMWVLDESGNLYGLTVDPSVPVLARRPAPAHMRQSIRWRPR